MKTKKMISILLAVSLAFGVLFALTGCGDKTGTGSESETKVPTGVKLSFYKDASSGTYDFYYPENAGIEVEDNSETYKILKDTEENYKIEMNLRENTTYKSDKDQNKEDFADTYKEFKIGEFDAYSCGWGRVLDIYILMDESDEWFTTFEISISPVSQSGNDDKGSTFFENNEEVKSIINSMVYTPADAAK